MDYHSIYQKLINTRRILVRSKKNGIFENHHIFPKCLGGTNDKENKILLTPKEHYIAHLLLVRMYSGKAKAKMSYALFQMCRTNPKQKRIVSASQFDSAKRTMIENCSGVNGPFYGKKHTQHAKTLASIAKRGDKNPFFGRSTWNKGKKLKSISAAHKNAISKANTGKIFTKETRDKISRTHKGIPKSLEHRQKISQVNMGKKLSEDTCRKMSESRRGVKQNLVTCPHCNKSGGIAMYRWHFDNCATHSLHE